MCESSTLQQGSEDEKQFQHCCYYSGSETCNNYTCCVTEQVTTVGSDWIDDGSCIQCYLLILGF